MFSRDEDMPQEVRYTVEDLLLKLGQKESEITLLRKRMEDMAKTSKVRRHEDEEEDAPPPKRREPSGGELASRTSSTGVSGSSSRTTDLQPQLAAWHIAERRVEDQPPAQAARPFGRTTGWFEEETREIRRPPAMTRGEAERIPTGPSARRRGTEAATPKMINGRPYESAMRVRPPGTLRPEPEILQHRTGRVPRTDPTNDNNEDPYEFSHSDEDSDEPILLDADDLADDHLVPRFWGVVRVPDYDGLGHEGYERDNSMRGMLSPETYHSRLTNDVYVGQRARDALRHERNGDAPYREHQPHDQVAVRTKRGLPMNPKEVAKLRTIVVDSKRRFSRQEQLEAFLLLKELHSIARRVNRDHHDKAMRLILAPGKFEGLESRVSAGMLQGIRPLDREVAPRPTQGPPLSGLMSLDDVGRHLLLTNRPGSLNPVTGVAFDYAFRVGRRSVFGYALARLLAPAEREAMHAFRWQFAMLVALPCRYRKAIVEHDRRNPQTPFLPQGGPTFSIHRARIAPAHVNNIAIDDVIQVLLDNRIPAEWVDHAYDHGVMALNGFYDGSPVNHALYDEVDNERLARLHRFGVPPAMAGWGGWRHPTEGEILQVHAAMTAEMAAWEVREGNQRSLCPSGLDSSRWLLVGQDGQVEYLTLRPQAVADGYAQNHPITLPSYAELDGALQTQAPVGGNPLADPPTSDVTMDANVSLGSEEESPRAPPSHEAPLEPLGLLVEHDTSLAGPILPDTEDEPMANPPPAEEPTMDTP